MAGKDVTAPHPPGAAPQFLPPQPDGAASRVPSLVSSASHAPAANAPESYTPPQGERSATATDYYSIIAGAIAGLHHNSPATRKEVYAHARQVVAQRLKSAVPPTPSHVIALEELSLDRAIKKIEAEQPASTEPPAPPEQPVEVKAAGEPVKVEAAAPAQTEQKSSPPVITAPRRTTPVQKPSQVRGVLFRVFLLVGLTAAGLVGYWISIGRPNLMELRDAARRSVASKLAPEAKETPTAPAPPPEAAQNNATPATDTDAETARAALELYEAQLDSTLAICRRAPDGDPCGNLREASPDLSVPGALVSWVSANATVLRVRPVAKAQWPTAVGLSPLQLANASSAAVEIKAGTTNSAARAKFESGKTRAQNNDLEGAIADFTDAVRLDPKYADALVERGQAFFKGGNTDRAIADFNQALQIDPRHVGAYKSRGMTMLYKNDSDSALIDLTRAIQFADMAPGTVSALEIFYARRSRAALYDRKQLYDREIVDLTSMIDSFWKSPELAATLKATYGEQGTSALIAALYKQRSGAHLRRRGIDAAIGDLSLAMQLDPPHALQYLIDRARIQENAGRREQAATDYKQALELNPKSDEIKAALQRIGGRN